MNFAALDHLTQFTGQLFDAVVKVATVAAPIILAYLAYRAKMAADAVHEVKADLAESTGNTDRKLDKVYHVVNGAMTEQLRLNAAQARRIAADHPFDVIAQEAAAAASKLYEDHLAEQKQRGRP